MDIRKLAAEDASNTFSLIRAVEWIVSRAAMGAYEGWEVGYLEEHLPGVGAALSISSREHAPLAQECSSLTILGKDYWRDVVERMEDYGGSVKRLCIVDVGSGGVAKTLFEVVRHRVCAQLTHITLALRKDRDIDFLADQHIPHLNSLTVMGVYRPCPRSQAVSLRGMEGLKLGHLRLMDLRITMGAARSILAARDSLKSVCLEYCKVPFWNEKWMKRALGQRLYIK